MNFTDIQNSLSDWEKLHHFSRPHDVFKLDWWSYDSRDFGDTFLPYVALIENLGIRIYDGARVFEGIRNLYSNVLKLEKNSLFKLVIYSYPEGAVINDNMNRLVISSDEICVFLSLDKSGNIQLRIVFGSKFKQFLTEYYKENGKKMDVSGIEKARFETDKQSFREYFGDSFNHQSVLLYLLSYLDVTIDTEFDDGSIRIKRLTDFNTLVPLGVKSYSKNPKEEQKKQPENEKVRFEIEILEKGIEELAIEIVNNEKVFSEYADGLLQSDGTPINKTKTFASGTYYFEWDGFDKNNLYDSKALTEGTFKLRLITKTKNVSKATESKPFGFNYQEADWIDIRIDKTTKRVDVALKVNLIDGGESGTDLDCSDSGNCPWDEVAPEAITNEGLPPIKIRTKTYKELSEAAITGINKFWGRNSTNIGKGVTLLGNNYEVYVSAEVSEKGMKAPKIVYTTNDDKERRSRNFFASRILFYNVGYFYYAKWQKLIDYSNYPNPFEAKRLYDNKGWYYVAEDIVDFEMTAAHEIGHEILLAYGGPNYSFSHKDSSTVITQTVTNNPLPMFGEIDLMQYYNKYYVINRTVAAETDVLGFFWLTKLKIK